MWVCGYVGMRENGDRERECVGVGVCEEREGSKRFKRA